MARSPGFKNTTTTSELISELRKPEILPETGWWNVGEEEPQEIPFEGTWGNYGNDYAPTSWYLSTNGETRLRGVVDGGNEGSIIFYLPEEVWPEYKQVFTCALVDTDGTANVSVDVDGAVRLEFLN